MSEPFTTLDELCINTIRTLSVDAIQKANSGHPGLPLGAAPMAYALWARHLRHNPTDPEWPNRDRFVLSPGHGSALIYSLLHLFGYPLTLDDIKDFRQWSSLTPGHPEAHLTKGVEATTGPLGQGAANAVGMAMAERLLAHRFNRPDFEIVDHYTYALISDGDVMEGVASEAASLAGHYRLGKLICLYDANDISLDGPCSLTFTEDVGKRYESYGWQVLHVDDGDRDLQAIDRAIEQARADTERPSLVVVKTTIGFGSPNRSGKSKVHGSPLGPEELALTKKALGWDENQHFHVPADARAHFDLVVSQGIQAQSQWEQQLQAYSTANPELSDQWKASLAGELPYGWADDLPSWDLGVSLATRVASSQTIQAIAQNLPHLVSGSADLSCSCKTNFADDEVFDGQTGKGRNVFWGVREHAMAAAANGMCYHGGVRPIVSTFFCFSDYMRPSIRLAAMNGLPVLYVWTHDSIGVGEDGPTHQPVEQLTALRTIPNMVLLRPGDPNETSAAWKWAVKETERPVGLVLSRQKMPVLEGTKTLAEEGIARGGYVLRNANSDEPRAIIIASGSELSLAAEAAEILENDGIPTRVVSFPSWELFSQQDAAYRQSVLPSNVPARVAVEAGVSLGWERWVGDKGAIIGMEGFGASAPGGTLMEKFGFTVEHVVETVRGLV